jgi:hypothetical protein
MSSVEDVELDFDPSDETEDDSQTSDAQASVAVVASTDWTVETLLNQLRRGNIELNPSFQRRDAWTVERKSRFIESLIMGIPVPQLVLAERRDSRGSYVVIDGKQRLLSLAQYRGYAPDSGRNAFSLERLSLRPALNGTSFEQLETSSQHFEDLNALENATIRTVVIRNWPTEDYLYLVFHRLNTGSVPLSPQELRQALHPGPFTEFLDKFSFESKSVRRALKLRGPDFRMRDAELMTRAYAFEYFLTDYAGNLKQFLDDTCKKLNSAWESREQEIEESARQLELAMDACAEIYRENAFRRFTRGTYESRFNRAVFDVQMLFMADPDIREAALRNSAECKTAFEGVSRQPAFADATGATTKSINATYTRLSLWADTFREVVGGRSPRITLVDNRIKIKR